MPDISSVATRPGLTHCRTCSAQLINPVYRSSVDLKQEAGSRFCYEIIERIDELPAYPETLILRINLKSSEIHLISQCTRAGGSWSTVDVLTRPGDDHELWIWDEMVKIKESARAGGGGAGVMRDEGEGEVGLKLSRPKWVHKVPKPVRSIMLHKLKDKANVDEYEVDLVFDKVEE